MTTNRSQLTHFGVNRTPWQTEGKSVEQFTDMRLAMTHAGLDFQVETSEVYQAAKSIDDEYVENLLLANKPKTVADYRKLIEQAMDSCFQPVESHNVIRRSDNQHVFGVCGNRWHPLQNVEAFDWFQPALDAGLVKLNTVGKLAQGRKIWILAELAADPTEIVPGDEIAKYIILGNGHDGGTAIFVGFTPIRVWCANMFPMLRKSASHIIRLRHSSHAKVNLDKLRDVMDFANREFIATAEQYRQLTNYTINQEDLEKYVKRIFLPASEQAKPLAELNTRKRNQLEEIMGLVDTGIGLQHPGIRGTWYAAFNGVNQYLNYDAARNTANRLNSLWFGQNRNVNEQALQVATEMAFA